MRLRGEHGGIVAAVATIACAACTYDVPDVALAAGPGSRPDSSVRDSAREADTFMDGGRLADTIVPDGPFAEDSGPRDGASETEGSVGPVCPTPITWKDETTFNANASATITLAAPSYAAGDVMLAYVAGYDAEQHGGTGTVTFMAAPGWSAVGTATQKGYYSGKLYLSVFSKVAGTVEPASYAFTASKSVETVAWILDYAGVSVTSPVDQQAGVGSTSVTHFVTPGLVTSGPGEVVIATFVSVTSPPATGWQVPGGTLQRASVADGVVMAGASDDELQLFAGPVGPFSSIPQVPGGGQLLNAVITHLLALRPCQ